MGTFGTDISDNDLYKDLEREFFDLYHDGNDIHFIFEKIIKNHSESINSDEDSNNFWFAISDFLWQCKSLNNEILCKIKEIVESKSDLKLWRELDASLVDIKEREISLNEFLKKISLPKKQAKRRVKKKLYNSIFKKGDLIIYKLENGNYGGAVVIHEEYQTECGYNWLVISDLNLISKPTLSDFKNSKVQYRMEMDSDKQYTYPIIVGLYGSDYQSNNENDITIEVIENVKIKERKIKRPDWYFGNWNVLSKRIPNDVISKERIKDWLVIRKWWK